MVTRPTIEELEARVRETMEVCDWEGFTAALTDLAERAREAEADARNEVVRLAVLAWQEPHEAFWWKSLGNALDAAGIDKERSTP